MTAMIPPRVQEVINTLTTRQMAEALVNVEATLRSKKMTSIHGELRITRAWLIEAIETRHPEVNGPLDAWASTDDDTPYVQVLINALPTEHQP